MRWRLVLVGIVALAGIVAACQTDTSVSHRNLVSADLELICADAGPFLDGRDYAPAVYLADNGTVYPLNGNAREYFEGLNGVRDPRNVLRGTPDTMSRAIHELIQEGLRRC